MQKATCLFITVCCLLLALSACAVTPAKDTGNHTADVQKQTSVPPTETVTEGTAPQDAVTTDSYTLFWEGEKCYMQRHPENSGGSFEADALRKAYYPIFSSLSEMQQKLKAGDLSEKEIAELMRYAPENTGIVEICNINKLYEAVYPENFEVEHIMFTGKSYSFESGTGKSDNRINGFIRYLSQDSYEKLFDDDYNRTIGGVGITVLSVEQVADRNAEVLRFYNIVGTESCRVRYTNETDHGTQYVLERYEKDTLRSIRIFGISNGAYYDVYLTDLKERPSIEWLSSFGLREYAEKEIS